MDLAVILSRIQFAFTAAFHFLFVPLTMGLIILVLIFEIKYYRTDDKLYRKMSNFWGNIFAINFIVGIVTGITMEIQFGTNWSEYSKFMGDIFGSPLAFEALMAFFLESTFTGIWIFYRNKISKRFRLITVSLITVGTHISAIWIITANGFMQNPVGYSIVDGKIRLESFWELITNPYVYYMLVHTLTSAYLLGGFFVIGISAYHLLKNNSTEFFIKSTKTALVIATISAFSLPFVGHHYAQYIAKINPAKAASFDAVWETQTELPFYLVQIPLQDEERNIEFFRIPYFGSYMYTNSFEGEVIGLKDIPKDERPNVAFTHYSFRVMVILGSLFILQVLLAWFYLYKKKYTENRLLLKMFLWSLPLPWIAITAGWIVAEVGRQPWIVYKLMRTADAVSKVHPSQIIFSLVTITLFYGLLFFVDVSLIKRNIKVGPDGGEF